MTARGCWLWWVLLVGCNAAVQDSPLNSQTTPQAERTSEALNNTSATQRSGGPGWPALFGPFRDSASPELGIATTWPAQGPPVLWSKPIGRGYSSPVAVDGRLLVLHRTDGQEHLDAYDPETGDRIWRRSYPTSYVCPVEYSDGPYSTPVIYQREQRAPVVISVSAEGAMRCLNLEDGSQRWRRNLHQEYPVEPWLFPVGASPLVQEDVIYFSLGSVVGKAGVIALRVEDGSTMWTSTNHGPSYATPVLAEIHGRKTLFTPTAEGLVSLQAETGELNWLYKMKRGSPDACNATSPVVMEDLAIMVTGPGPGAVCLQVLPDGSYQRVWRDRRVLDSQFNTLLPVEDYLYGFTAKKQGGATFRCVHAATGKLQWQYRSDLGRGSAIRVAGHFILWGEDGHLASLEVREDKLVEKAITPEPLLPGPCYASPALLNGRLYLRNEGTLLCLDLRASAP